MAVSDAAGFITLLTPFFRWLDYSRISEILHKAELGSRPVGISKFNQAAETGVARPTSRVASFDVAGLSCS